ncbi:phosphate regulon sensor histidine kinase PhoR [Shewanella sp. NIFS-20-20]|uniref:phosphate regulon sensor histidine kinase PhoR n=1 Tax=Shewanella sp. NIFS-20-20 TaxID=2853806 RepID=UPI001C48543A|nr:phosphate regulon sensor histidine kinase PhoR [Shewanella sp. NIFS-20-20]MBV7317565.1 phosphate regulon sensor histidine kinase PhoR [Shewanella sp. NIFS-20-20]
MFTSYSGYRLFGRIALILVAATALGLVLDALLPVLFCVACAWLIWHYRQLMLLNYWLWRDKRITPPQGTGSWEGVFNGIYRLQQKNRRKINQLLNLLGRFRQGAEALPDAAVVLDGDRNIVWCNRLAQLLLGLEWPKDNGQRLDNLLRHPDFIHYINGHNFLQPLELPSPIADGKLLEIRLMAYGDSQLLLIARDISRIRQLENMRRDFVANVSHELKTPLTVLQGYLEVMQSMADEGDINQKPLGLMHEQTQRMRTMIEQLLVLSRIEAADDVDLNHQVDMDKLRVLLEQEANALSLEQHQLEFDWQPGLWVLGDTVQMQSACSNLLSNAIRYTPAGGIIRVSWKSVTHGARFCVQDSGDGIAMQHISRLTERFYRVDSARSRQTGGSGLGLAIVKHALNRHHSQLSVVSHLGRGSQFSFIIPPQLLLPSADVVSK